MRRAGTRSTPPRVLEVAHPGIGQNFESLGQVLAERDGAWVTMHLTSRSLSALALLVLAPEPRADGVNGLRSSVARVRDVNGDGVHDLAVASLDRSRPERVWILSGKNGARLREFQGKQAGDRFGSEIVDLGDWDGDGATDLAIEARARAGHWGYSPHGYRRVVSTKSGETLFELDFVGPLGGARDLDGDGKLDLLVSNDAGDVVAIRVLSGADRRTLLDVELRRRVVAPHASYAESLARGVEALIWIDDLDEDGRPDCCAVLSEVGRVEPHYTPECTLTARSGRDGKEIWTRRVDPNLEIGFFTLRRIEIDASSGCAELLLANEDRYVRLHQGKDGALIRSTNYSGGRWYSMGSSLEVLGDVDRDGCEDWIVGANESWFAFDAGRCTVVSGKTGEVLHSLKEDERFGYDACGIGDVDGDGVPDFAVGAECRSNRRASDDAEPYVQVRSGKDASLLWMKRHVDLRK